MRALFVIALALVAIGLLMATGAWAQTTCQQIGNQTFCNGPNGSTMTGQRIGTQEFWSGSLGVPSSNGGTRSVPFNQHCQQIGNQTFCN
jgi:hypothetical protein